MKSDNAKFVTDWSSDGRFILYTEFAATTASDVWALPLFDEQKPIQVLKSNFNESQATFSPDGHWIAYASNESGLSQIYVQSFPAAGGKWMISIKGGVQPRWRHDGKELFYMAFDGKLMAVTVKANDSNFEAGAPSALLDVRIAPSQANSNAPYSPTSDGQRFLINTLASGASPLPAVVVQNWAAALKK